MPYPFLGLGFNSWAQKYSRGSASAPTPRPALLQYTTIASTSTFKLRSTGTVDYVVDWGDGTTESLTTNNPAHGYSSAGEYTIKITPAEGSTYRPYFNDLGSDSSIASISGAGGSQLGTDLSDAWDGTSNMGSFSGDIDTSSVTSFNFAWRKAGLTSFPLLDFSSATSLLGAWQQMPNLTSFPANMFDTTGTLASTAFDAAWDNSSLSAQSIENILVSLDTNGASNISLGIGGGTNAAKTTWSTAANTAYTNLINKGWTISYNP